MLRRRLVVGALVVSLFFNVFALAFAATVLNRQPLQRLNKSAVLDLGYKVADSLPEPGASSLRARLDQMRPDVEAAMAAYRQSVRKAARILEEDEVDSEALAAAIVEARDSRAVVGDRLTSVFVETISDMPVETRKRLIRRFVQN